MYDTSNIIMYSSIISFSVISFVLIFYYILYEEEVAETEEEFEVIYEESNPEEESLINDVRVHGKHE